ncbi:MAG: ABC transporter substrate-binding protein [Vicinamibacterales bacterium]
MYLIWRDIQPPARSSLGGTTEAPPPTRGGRLVVSQRSEPRSFNRLVSLSTATDVFTHLTQARLVRVNRATRALEPGLAERWDAAPDARTFTLTLREGLRWSDGAPFGVEDVLFTFRALYDPKARSPIATSLLVQGKPLDVSSPAPRTIRVVFPAPFGPGLRLLDNVPILPRHKLEAALEAGTFAEAWSAATPPGELAGMGPFQLARYEPGQRLVLSRNPHYWRTGDDGTALPYLDEVTLEIVPDQNAELLRLQSGAIDMQQQALRAEDIAALQPQVAAQSVRLIELGVSTDPDVFFINLREPYWKADPRRGWVTRRELRQAISYAVDREAFAEDLFLGAAVPIWGPVTPGNTEWFSPNVPRYPYSPERARELLAGLGFANRDADEWLEDPQGHEARLTVLTYRGNTVLEREAGRLADDLRQVGVALDVVPLEQNALIERMLGGDFEAIYFGYNATDLDPALSKDFWLSSGAAHIWNLEQASPATEWEGRIDALMAQQASATDPAERRRLFAEVQRIFGEELPALYFVAPRLYMGVSGRTTNLHPSVLRPQLLWAADAIAVTP